MYQNISGDDVFEGLALAVASELEKEKIAKDVAILIAVQVTQQMRLHLGGQTVYFPKSWAATKNARDQEIFKAFDGTNYQALAMQYQLTEMRIRQIVGRAIQVDRERRRRG